jgi:predicted small metal-binding protein
MKTMTCNQLGGACELEFHADTFEEMSEMSKAHGMEMFQKGDKAHLDAMEKMKSQMKSPDDYMTWFEAKRNEFEALSENT